MRLKVGRRVMANKPASRDGCPFFRWMQFGFVKVVREDGFIR